MSTTIETFWTQNKKTRNQDEHSNTHRWISMGSSGTKRRKKIVERRTVIIGNETSSYSFHLLFSEKFVEEERIRYCGASNNEWLRERILLGKCIDFNTLIMSYQFQVVWVDFENLLFWIDFVSASVRLHEDISCFCQVGILTS